MTILIAGDSWGCGEWNIACTEILHKGLEQYLIDDGYCVFNVSKPSISNLDIINRINQWYDRFEDIKIEKIFVFQTEFTRDFKHDIMQQMYGANDWSIKTVDDLASTWVERFYFRLSEIAQEKKCKIYLLGGASDTMWFDNMENDYPGCSIACQSVTNLILEKNPKIEVPVFSWFTKNTEELVKKLKKIVSAEDILNQINLGIERESLLEENPNFFFPDGIHPNRTGHKILYDFLKEQQLL